MKALLSSNQSPLSDFSANLAALGVGDSSPLSTVGANLGGLGISGCSLLDGGGSPDFALIAGSYHYPPGRIYKFSRAATATYVDGGVLKYAAANEARYQDGLLLIEDAATNLCPRSNAFDLWVQTGTPAPTQNETGPDGVPNAAWTLTDNSGSFEFVSQTNTLSATTYTRSLFVKKTTGAQPSYPAIIPYSGAQLAACTVDTSNGIATVWTAYTGYTVVASSAICEDFNADFWRVSLTFAATAAVWDTQIVPAGTTNPTQSTGTAKAAAQGSAVIFGSQLNIGSVATSYIPTTTAAVTRDADVCRIYD